MATLILFNARESEVKPAGEKFTLEELQGYVGGFVQRLEMSDGNFMYMDEEGKQKEKPENRLATHLMAGIIEADTYICGDVLIAAPAEVN